MRRLALFVFLTTAASAQPTSWSTLTPAAGVAVPLGDGFGAPWESGAGLSVRTEVPAYGGRLRGEVRVAAYDPSGDVDRVPPFALALPTVGWGPTVGLGPVRLSAGPRVGVALFRIDDPDAGRLQSETEIAVGGWAGAAVALGRVEVWAQADGTRLTLSDPVTLWAASGGLAVRLDTPAWLREVLR